MTLVFPLLAYHTVL